ncbi:MAG: TrbG/VirB9 family P-type conjugative transfer protein [Acidobacteria bacterium]|nr:TrbG/VirB9 family P-type conjugative transfer protein [Acidobacteriota bacterium]
MRAWALSLGFVLAVTPAAAQVPDAPALQDAPVTVMTRVRHVSTVVLPETAEIVEVVAGDPERWDVSAAAHLVFVRPLVEGARSNVVLLTAAGDVVPVAVVESADAAVDAVVRVGTAAVREAHGEPVLASAEAVEAVAVQAAETWAAVAAAEAQAAGRVETARIAALERLDENREAYPRQLQFDYRLPAGAAGYPWLVEGMWHDGRRTYLRTRAIAPVLHERNADGLEPVDVSAVLDDVVHVVPRVLGAGALEVGGRRLPWTARPRKAGP